MVSQPTREGDSGPSHVSWREAGTQRPRPSPAVGNDFLHAGGWAVEARLPSSFLLTLGRKPRAQPRAGVKPETRPVSSPGEARLPPMAGSPSQSHISPTG